MTNDNNYTINRQTKKYRTILSDPPWDINQKGNYGAIRHYELMPLDRIKAMPIADLTEDNAHFWLWVTNRPQKRFVQRFACTNPPKTSERCRCH